MNRCVALALCLVPALAQAQPVTGLYLGAGGGGNLLQDERVDAFDINGSPFRSTNYGFHPGLVGLASVGYGFGNGLRIEIEGSYRRNSVSQSPHTDGVESYRGHGENYGPMANALYDIDLGLPWLQPYLGAGLGYQWTRISEQIAGSVVQASRGGTDGRFAYQGIVGNAVPVPSIAGLSLTAEYRYLGLAGDHTVNGIRTETAPLGGAGLIRIKTSGDDNHAFLFGLRYELGVVELAPPAVAAQPAAPAPAPARTYLVFFDWDSAALSARAKQIVAEAAQASTRIASTRIEVDGYTDSSGTEAYNQRLGLRRAEAVAAELVRGGVARQAITIKSFGESHPLVAVAEGVREPQNRRVEIDLR